MTKIDTVVFTAVFAIVMVLVSFPYQKTCAVNEPFTICSIKITEFLSNGFKIRSN